MSDLIINKHTVSKIVPHPNADRLEIVDLDGWQIVSAKGSYKIGDRVIHVQPDSMIPRSLAETWGVDKYLVWKAGFGKGRVRAASLRGVPSFGFLAPCLPEYPDDNLPEFLNIEKYDPPRPEGMGAGQVQRAHGKFHHYTNMENLRNRKHKLNYNEPVVVTEKIHGCNSRVGIVRYPGQEWELVVGSHRTQRNLDDSGVFGIPLDLYGDKIKALLDDLARENPDSLSILLFGEIFGPGVQDLTYGKEKQYRAFDLAIDGAYTSFDNLERICGKHGIPVVPRITTGIFSFEELVELAQGDTTLEIDHIREGIVIQPVEPSHWKMSEQDPNPKRSIFKLISNAYLIRKGGTEYH